MKHFVAVLALVISLASASQAQALRARIAHGPNVQSRGDLIVTVAGKDKTLARDVRAFRVFDKGRTLLWIGFDGAGGFENEGQSLWRLDSATGRSRKLLAETYEIDAFQEARGRSGRRVWVLTLGSGGLSWPHIHVIRDNGESLWRQMDAQLYAIKNGRVLLTLFHGDPETPGAPRRIVYRTIDALLHR
ncbi:MAG TPA: hypothetical protein VF681_00790 [Abditibacteriaceae bacterium]|jgi:hypothetical protein